jgi:hypothetical protein
VRVARVQDVTSEPSPDATIVLDRSGSLVFSLNAIGSLVWQLLPGDLDEMVDDICARFPAVPRSVIDADVVSFVQELQRRGLVEVDAGP